MAYGIPFLRLKVYQKWYRLLEDYILIGIFRIFDEKSQLPYNLRRRKTVICHTAAMNFGEAVRLSKHAENAGADAISAIPPLFFHYRESDICSYYKTLAESTSLPFTKR